MNYSINDFLLIFYSWFLSIIQYCFNGGKLNAFLAVTSNFLAPLCRQKEELLTSFSTKFVCKLLPFNKFKQLNMFMCLKISLLFFLDCLVL